MDTYYWDDPSERRYSTGVEQVLLYKGLDAYERPMELRGVISITKSHNIGIDSYVQEGSTFFNAQTFGTPTYTIRMYDPLPVERMFHNADQHSQVFSVHDQPAKLAYLVYVTNWYDGNNEWIYDEFNFVWNLMLVPGDVASATRDSNAIPREYEHVFHAAHNLGFNGKKDVRLSHISVQYGPYSGTRRQELEDAIYSGSSPHMPTPEELYKLVYPYG